MLRHTILGMTGTGYVVAYGDREVIGNVVATPANSEAGIRFGNDGKIYQRVADGGAYSFLANWLSPQDSIGPTGYEALATMISGSLTTGTVGSRVALSSNRDWTKRATSPTGGPNSAVFTLAIYPIGSAVAADSQTMTLTVEVTP